MAVAATSRMKTKSKEWEFVAKEEGNNNHDDDNESNREKQYTDEALLQWSDFLGASELITEHVTI